MNATVRSEQSDGVHTLTIDAPARRNALSRALMQALGDALAGAAQAPAGAVVVTGAGGVFSAGADLGDLDGTPADRAVDDALDALCERVRAMPVPVLAAVEGPCIGGALQLALACDALVAGEGAFFEIPATRLGLLYNPDAVARLHARLGGAMLRSLLLLGERLDAGAALRAGLATHHAHVGAALERAVALARGAAAGSPPAVRATRSLLTALDAGERDLDEWRALRERILGSPGRREAVRRARARLGL